MAIGNFASCKLAVQAGLTAPGSTQTKSEPEEGSSEGQLEAEGSLLFAVETSHGTVIYPGAAALPDNFQAKAASWCNQQEDSRSAEHVGGDDQTESAAEAPALSLAAAPATSRDSPPAATDSREAASPGSRAPVAVADASFEQTSATGAPRVGSGLAAGLGTADPAAADLVKLQLDTSTLQQLCTAAVMKECHRALLGIELCFQALRTAETAAASSLEAPRTRVGQAAVHGNLSAAQAASACPRAPGATNTSQTAAGGPAMDEAPPQHSVYAAGPKSAPLAVQQAGPGPEAAAAHPGAGRQHRAASTSSVQGSDGTGEAHGMLAEPDGPAGTAPAGCPTCKQQASAGGAGSDAQHFHSRSAVQSARLQHGAHAHLQQGRGGHWPPCEMWDYQHPMPRRRTTTGEAEVLHSTELILGHWGCGSRMLDDFNIAEGALDGKLPVASHSASGRHHAAVTAPPNRHPVAMSISEPFQSWQLRRASSHHRLPASFSQEDASHAQQLLQLGSRPHLTPSYHAALKLMQWTAAPSDAHSSDLQLLSTNMQQLMRQGCWSEFNPTYAAAMQSTKQELAPAAPAAASGSSQTAGPSRGTAHTSTKLHRAARSVLAGCQDVRCASVVKMHMACAVQLTQCEQS